MNLQAAGFAASVALGGGAAGAGGVSVVAQAQGLPDFAQFGISGAILGAWLLTVKWSYSFMGKHIDKNTEALADHTKTLLRVSENDIRAASILERIEKRLDDRA